MMAPPKLNRKLELQRRVMTADGAGGFDVEWVTLGTIYAAVEARRGTEREYGGRMVPSVVYTFIARAAPHGSPSRPQADQRLVEGSRAFSILAVTERDLNGMYLELWVEEGRDDT